MFNIAAMARPYLGAVVLSVGLLTAGGSVLLHAHGQRRLSGSDFSTHRRRRQETRPGRGQDGDPGHAPARGGRQHGAGRIAQVRCKTIRGGMDISIDFNPSTDIKQALQYVWNRIGAAESVLPAGVEIQVEQMTPSVNPIISVVLTGGDSPAQLRDYAYYQLAPQIKNKIKDVLYANVSGSQIREIEVEARPNDLLAAGLSAADLADEIGKVHRLEPVGRVERGPFAFQLVVDNQVKSAQDIADLRIKLKNGQSIQVSDVADVKVAYQDRVNSIGVNLREGVVVSIFRRLGGNTVGIADELARVLETASQLPKNIQADDRLRPVAVHQQRRRERSRRHRGRRPVQHPDPAGVPAQLAGHADLRPVLADHAGHHLPVHVLRSAKRST